MSKLSVFNPRANSFLYEGFLVCLDENIYICEDLRVRKYESIRTFSTENAMCRQSSVGTYLTLSALHDNAQSFVFPFETITVGHFL